ncbi:hypothetical protein C8R42DRAFT_706608 [Lentinula raphanica]|nr:hypothetical protein C8R42DRAFT_706608 [Lentinula raphanica]
MLRRSQRVKDKEDSSVCNGTQEPLATALGSNMIPGSKYTRDDEDDIKEDEEDDDDYKGDEEEDDEAPQKKRLRKTVSAMRQRVPEQFRKVRGKLGLLEKLAKEMPLDVILEIFCYLEPGDLLRLARTTRDLRDILMSKSRESIWRLARGNVEELPPRPADLNEPQYANFLFESYCHSCLRSNKRCKITILWNFRMRACRKCLRTFPKVHDARIPGDHPLNAHRYNDIFPTERVIVNNSHRAISNPVIVERYKTEYDALDPQQDRDAWIISKRNKRLAIEEHSNCCRRWHSIWLDNRADELAALRKDRKKAILNRLEEIGWRAEAELIIGDDWYDFDDFSSLKSVKQSKKLTDQGWHSIKDEIVEFLSNHRDQRMAYKRGDLLCRRVTRIAGMYSDIFSKADLRGPQPTIGDILCDQLFSEFFLQDPLEYDFTDDDIHSKLLELLPEFVDKWRAAKEQELLEIIQGSLPLATLNDLHLAITFFECEECSSPPLYYPQILYHYCCVKHIRAPLDALEYHFRSSMNYKGPWSHLSIKFNNTYSNRAKALLEKCSLDPDTATSQDIDDANLLFECITCKRDLQFRDGGRYFMRWPLPLLHDQDHTLAINDMDKEEKEVITASEPSISSKWYFPICCAHCHKTSDSWDFHSHLKAKHKDLVDFPESEIPPKLQDIRRHWYWNPHLTLDGFGQPFRYREDSATASVVELNRRAPWTRLVAY